MDLSGSGKAGNMGNYGNPDKHLGPIKYKECVD